ncbi:MAG TPA: C1 family peptidase [Chitinophagaceae bacterium]|nr:C1 family peptidase [Chitinophagaceae bacterium]
MFSRLILTSLLFFFISSCNQAQTLSVEELQLKPPSNIHCTTVKDQHMSSTCWSFASNSLLESDLLKKGLKDVDLSEMFVARYSYLRKIKRHLQLKGGNFFTPGGQFHDVIWVARNYGMVPESAYPGLTDGNSSHNHAKLDTVIKHFVDDLLAKGMNDLDEEGRHFADSVFDHYLGPVPDHFIYQGKEYTAQTYLREVLSFNPDDYIEITSYTHHPFYKKFVLEDKYNWTNDEYYNVPLEDFSAIADLALKNGFSVGWDGDANDPGFAFYDGLAYLDGDGKTTAVQRQQAFEDHSTALDHMMHIVGVAKDKNGHKWYYVKNSWGQYSNELDGFLYMREDYFRIRTVAIIVNKNALSTATRQKLGL